MLFSILVGLTGGIASGKSTVSHILSGHKLPIVDADKIAHEVVEPGMPAYNAIVKAFGPDSLVDSKPGNAIDREHLGRLIFGNEDRRRVLNRCTHPYIIRAMWWQIFKNWIAGHSIIVVDAPLLFEAGLAPFMTYNVVVYVPEDLQLERLLKRQPGLTSDEALKRIHAQMPIEKKLKLADKIIDNTGSVEDTEKKVRDLVINLRKEYPLFVLRRLSLLVALPVLVVVFRKWIQ